MNHKITQILMSTYFRPLAYVLYNKFLKNMFFDYLYDLVTKQIRY